MDSMSVPRRATIIAVCAVAAAAVAVLGARALSASASEDGKPPRPVTPAVTGTGPAAPRVHQVPTPAPTDYWTRERVEQAEPAPMPITDE